MANGAFTPGTGRLKSDDLIGAFLELAYLVQTQEFISAEDANATIITNNNLTVPDLLDITANLNLNTLAINATGIPLTTSTDANGNMIVSAVDYLAPIEALGVDIDATLDVTGSDLHKTNKVEALFELAQLIQRDELANPDKPQNLTLTVDTDTLTANITANFVLNVYMDAINGMVKLDPVNYLA